MENNNNNNKDQQNEMEKKEFNLRLYLYHFPNGQKALVLPLTGEVADVEVLPVYQPSHSPEETENA